MNIANVKLLFACDKNWNSMSACIDGRYCKFCDKRIIDLTTTSSEEIRKIYSISNGNVCGRFKASQIISAPSQRPNLFKQIAVTFLLFFGINIYSKNLIAQITDNPDTIPTLDEHLAGFALGYMGIAQEFLENIKKAKQ